MEQLIKGSTAYKIFCREAEAGRLAHAYMLSFNDPANLRRALTVFALRFFGVAEADRTGGQIVRGTYPDCKLLPEEGKKFNAEAAVALIEDCAMRPAAGDRKLYLISSFDECSPVVQNKLLKSRPRAQISFWAPPRSRRCCPPYSRACAFWRYRPSPKGRYMPLWSATFRAVS